MTSEPTDDQPRTAPLAAARGAAGPLPLAAGGSRGRGQRGGLPSGLLACLALLLACMTMAPTAGAREKAGNSAAATAPAASSAASAPSADDSKDPQDPVVGQVLEMLRGGVGEPVVVAWLDKSGKRPATVSSSDLVALHKAGASDDLLKRLVESAIGAKQPAAAAPTTAGAAAPVTAGAAAAKPPAATLPAPAAAAATAAASPAAAATGAEPVKVRFAVSSRAVFVVEDTPWAEPWQLVLYVDGHFIASVRPGPALVPSPARNFDRVLAPGKHLLRLTSERHPPYHRSSGYISRARVDPSEFPFELQPGQADQAPRISVHFGERSSRHPGPIAFRVEQDGREVARLEPAAPGTEAWPALCEDILTALPAGARLPAAARQDLKTCVHWAALWPGFGAVPAREEARGEMERATQPPGGTN